MCRISRFVALSAAKPNLSLKTSGLMSLKNLFLCPGYWQQVKYVHWFCHRQSKSLLLCCFYQAEHS